MPANPAEQEKKLSDPQAEAKSHIYDIHRIPIPDPEYMSETPPHIRNKDIPGFPSTVAAVGPPSSGKTNVLFNLLTRPEFWKGFFDVIYELGPTVESDKIYKAVKLNDDQKVSDPDKFLAKLQEWVEKQKQEVKQDPHTAPKSLFIFEDITAYRDVMQNSEIFMKCFTAIRHHKATAYANVHKLTGLNRTCRVSCMHIMLWPSPRSEVKQAHQDYGIAELDLNDFMLVCRFAWKAEPNNPKPFLYINRYASEEDRYRKCFTKIIKWQDFVGLTKTLRKGSRRFTDLFAPSNIPKKKEPEVPYGPMKEHEPKESVGDSKLVYLK